MELALLKGAAAIKANAPTAVLISVEQAISGCGKARMAAALLAVMEGIAELESYTASELQEAALPLQQLGPAAGGTATHTHACIDCSMHGLHSNKSKCCSLIPWCVLQV